MLVRAVCIGLLSSLCSLAQGELPLGIVAEKPAEGPAIQTPLGWMVPYSQPIAGTEQIVEMVPVPGGTFTMGSPATEEKRHDDEGPVCTITLPPYWVGKYETTWGQYWPFMELNGVYAARKSLQTMLASPDEAKTSAIKQVLANKPELAASLAKKVDYVDGITAPTPLYDSSTTYASGEDPKQPAVTMTPYAARQFTKWLSALSGLDYRLPTEAEWEYAARAGTTTAYPWGDSADEIDDHAWYTDNSDYATHKVGGKLPNAWGLHDMIGNAAEIVVDEYSADEYAKRGAGPITWAQAVRWPTKAYPRVARGGYWDSFAEDMRSAARMPTNDEDWKVEDPNLPKSPWWFTDDPAGGIGFRIVRSVEPLTPELRKQFWEIDAATIASDVANRVAEGRGKLGPVGPDLPLIREQIKSPEVQKLIGE